MAPAPAPAVGPPSCLDAAVPLRHPLPPPLPPLPPREASFPCSRPPNMRWADESSGLHRNSPSGAMPEPPSEAPPLRPPAPAVTLPRGGDGLPFLPPRLALRVRMRWRARRPRISCCRSSVDAMSALTRSATSLAVSPPCQHTCAGVRHRGHCHIRERHGHAASTRTSVRARRSAPAWIRVCSTGARSKYAA